MIAISFDTQSSTVKLNSVTSWTIASNNQCNENAHFVKTRGGGGVGFCARFHEFLTRVNNLILSLLSMTMSVRIIN